MVVLIIYRDRESRKGAFVSPVPQQAVLHSNNLQRHDLTAAKLKSWQQKPMVNVYFNKKGVTYVKR